MKKSRKFVSKSKSRLKPIALATVLAGASFLMCSLPEKAWADTVDYVGEHNDAATIGGGNHDEYNDWIVTIGDGSTQTIYNVGNKTAISLKNGAVIHITKNAVLQNNVGNGTGNYGTGGNTIETNSHSKITVDGILRKTGNQNSAEAINVHGYYNHIIVGEDGLIETEYSAAIWFQNSDRDTVKTGEYRNVVDNYGIIRRTDGGSVIGSSNSEGVIFYNRDGAIVDGSLSFANGNDTLIFEDNSVVTGNIDGGLGINELYLQGVSDPDPVTGANILTGAIKNFTTLTKQGTGRWDVSGSLSGFTIVTVQDGILGLTGNNDNYNGTVFVNPDGILEARAQSLPTYDGNLANVTNSGIVRFNQNDYGTYIGQIVDGSAGSGRVEKIGSGTVYLKPEAAGGNTYSGGTYIYSGTLAIDRAAAIGSGAITFAYSDLGTYNNNTTRKWSTMQFLNSELLHFNNDINIGNSFAAILDAQNGQVNINGDIKGNTANSDLVKSGEGVMVLNGDNSFYRLMVEAGNLVITDAKNVGSGQIRLEDYKSSGSKKSMFTIVNDHDITLNNGFVVGNNFTGTINAATNYTTTFTQALSSLSGSALEKAGPGKVVFDAARNPFNGTITVHQGHLVFNGATDLIVGAEIKAGILEANDIFGYLIPSASKGTKIYADGKLQGTGKVIGTIDNSGIIMPGNSDNNIGAVLTLEGDYIGREGSIIEIHTALHDDGSPTSMLVINGDTCGDEIESLVYVVNKNGLGELTDNGIKIIEVNPGENGQSHSGAFKLAGDFMARSELPAIVAGAYTYRMEQGGENTSDDGHWYLKSLTEEYLNPDPDDGTNTDSGSVTKTGAARSARTDTPVYNPAAVLYEAYPNVLLAYQQMNTLEERVGNRKWSEESSATTLVGQNNGLWARVEGYGSRYKPNSSTYGKNNRYDVDYSRMQIGYDRVVQQRENSMLVAGINFDIGNIEGKVGSDLGTGKLKSHTKGIGATLTWYGQEGLYLDTQFSANWYDTSIYSHTLFAPSQVNGNNGFGYGLSLEVGKKIPRNANWSLTPQFQLAYTNVDFDSFVDTHQVQVSRKKSDSLLGRLGLAVNYEKSYGLSVNGTPDKYLKLYGIVDLYQQFKNGTAVDVSGVEFAQKNDKTWLGLSFGGTHLFKNGKYSIYGEIGVRTSVKNFGDSYSYRGEVGFRWNF